jgi:glycosyltransferase involved in cell wall biosynthesis
MGSRVRQPTERFHTIADRRRFWCETCLACNPGVGGDALEYGCGQDSCASGSPSIGRGNWPFDGDPLEYCVHMWWRSWPRPRAGVPLAVLIVDDAMSATGSVRWATALAEQWVRSGLSVSMFVLLDRRRIPSTTPTRIPLATPPPGVSMTYGGRPGARLRRALPQSLPRFARAVTRADVVVLTSEVGFSVPLSYFACRVLGRPLVVMALGVMNESLAAWVPRRWRRLWLHCLRNAEAIVCATHESAAIAGALGVSADRVSIAPSGVDPDEVVRRARSSPPEVAVSDDRPVLLSCAELSARKGHDLLLRAFAAVRMRGYDVRLVILGDGPERAALERLAADLGVADSAQLPGFVRDPYPEMLASELFCLASRSESFGICLLEAMALGVPTVAADADGGGPRILLDGGRLGALVAPNSVEALTEAIIRHLEHPEILRSRAAAGPAHVRQFAPSTTAARYQEIFTQVTRRPRPGGATAGHTRSVR